MSLLRNYPRIKMPIAYNLHWKRSHRFNQDEHIKLLGSKKQRVKLVYWDKILCACAGLCVCVLIFSLLSIMPLGSSEDTQVGLLYPCHNYKPSALFACLFIYPHLHYELLEGRNLVLGVVFLCFFIWKYLTHHVFSIKVSYIFKLCQKLLLDAIITNFSFLPFVTSLDSIVYYRRHCLVYPKLNLF